MKTFSRLPAFGLIILILCLMGCSSNSSDENGNVNTNSGQAANTGNANGTKDELEDFREIVKLNYEPEEVVWREDGGNPDNSTGTRKKLIAVMRFAPEDSNKIIAQAAALKAGTPLVIETESWYPAELIAQSQISGDETVKGVTYPANDFLQPPYVNGKLTRVESSDYFILELTTY